MIRHIVNFIKIEHTAFSLPLVFTGAWLGAGFKWPAWRVMVLILLAATGARAFGMSLNRVVDRRIDACNPRTAGRELPRGAMGVGSALVITGCALGLYLLACVLLGGWCLWLAPVPLVPLAGYSLLKRFTAFCHFGIGLCLALAPLGAFVAAAGHIRLTDQVLLFSAFVFFWLSGADIIYAVLDIDHDRRYRIHSIPARLGSASAQGVSAGLHVLALMCLAAILFISRARWPALAAFSATLGLFVLMYLPVLSIQSRFFPVSTLAGVAGALTPLLM